MQETIHLRAHHLLCAQGFRGLGYSKAFAENFSAVLEGLRKGPGTLVEAIDRPDVLCAACPHLEGDRCRRGAADVESKVKEADQKVLKHLGLSPGAKLCWGEWLRRIGSSIGPTDLPAICGNCPWLAVNYCVIGLARLRDGL